MTLDEACDQFERFFGAVEVNSIQAMSSIVCSGALGVADRPPPVLCISEELAVELWQRAALDLTEELVGEGDPKKFRLTWVEEPRTMMFRMTLQDASGAQRIASNRFAVYSVLAISELEPVEHAPDEPAEPASIPESGNSGAGRAEPDEIAGD